MVSHRHFDRWTVKIVLNNTQWRFYRSNPSTHLIHSAESNWAIINPPAAMPAYCSATGQPHDRYITEGKRFCQDCGAELAPEATAANPIVLDDTPEHLRVSREQSLQIPAGSLTAGRSGLAGSPLEHRSQRIPSFTKVAEKMRMAHLAGTAPIGATVQRKRTIKSLLGHRTIVQAYRLTYTKSNGNRSLTRSQSLGKQTH